MKIKSRTLLALVLSLALIGGGTGTALFLTAAPAGANDDSASGEDTPAQGTSGGERLDVTMDDVDDTKNANTASSFKTAEVEALNAGDGSSSSSNVSVSGSSNTTGASTPASNTATPASNTTGTATPASNASNTATPSNTPASSGSVTDPFRIMSGTPPAETARQGGQGQAVTVPLPPARPADLNPGSVNSTSLDQDRQTAFDLFKKGIKEKDKGMIEEAMDMYQKMVYASSRKDGKSLYFLGRCKEELYRLSNDKAAASDANKLFKEAAEKLKASPDTTKSVSAQDAEDKVDTVGAGGETSGEFGGLRPVTHRISSQFGMRNHPVSGGRKMHKGIDFACPQGTSVKSLGNGKIIKSGWENGYGKVIVVEHTMGGKKIYTRYAHLSQTAPVGTTVTRGQTIPGVKTGNTGVGTGAHLHFEVRFGGPFGEAVNPMKYFGVLSKNQ